MSMVFCRGCGKEIHDSAPACPQCGAVQVGVAGSVVAGGAEVPIGVPIAAFAISIFCALMMFGMDDSDWVVDSAVGFVSFVFTGFVLGIVGMKNSSGGRWMAISAVVLTSIGMFYSLGLISSFFDN